MRLGSHIVAHRALRSLLATAVVAGAICLVLPATPALALTNILGNPSFETANPAGTSFVDCSQPSPASSPVCLPNNSSGLQPTGAADWGMWDYANGNGAVWAENDRVPTTLTVTHADHWMLHVSGSPNAGILQYTGSSPADAVTWSVWVDPLIGTVEGCIGPIGSAPGESCDQSSVPCATSGQWDELCGTYDNVTNPGEIATEMLIGGVAGPAPYTDFYVDDASWTEASATTATLYVATTGQNTGNNCLNRHHPCATISYAVTQAASGDAIDVAGGQYTDNVTIPGSLQDLTIQGSTSSQVTVTGASAASVFTLDTGSSVTINNVQASGGQGTELNPGEPVGGGVDVEYEAVASLTDDTFSGNAAGYAGGGVFNEGNATLTDDTVSGNSSLYGGGITNWGYYMFLQDDTISGNTSAGNGGGLDTNANIVLVADTVAANTADGAAGGIYNYGPLAIAATLIGDNTQGTGGVCANITTGASGDGVIYDQGYNLDPDDSCGLSSADSDLPGVNAQLGGLNSNGGPTQTMAPSPGSPAQGAIPNGAVSLPAGSYPVTPLCGTTAAPDQRGYARPQIPGAACAIGAVELYESSNS